MRIGLDLDGLLDERPDFFAFLTAALRGGGHYVAVLTYRDPASRDKTEGQLREWGIAFDELQFARSLRVREHGQRDGRFHLPLLSETGCGPSLSSLCLRRECRTSGQRPCPPATS